MKKKNDTLVKCDASHTGLGATLEQKTEDNEWVTIAFASRYLNGQGKKIFDKRVRAARSGLGCR